MIEREFLVGLVWFAGKYRKQEIIVAIRQKSPNIENQMLFNLIFLFLFKSKSIPEIFKSELKSYHLFAFQHKRDPQIPKTYSHDCHVGVIYIFYHSYAYLRYLYFFFILKMEFCRFYFCVRTWRVGTFSLCASSHFSAWDWPLDTNSLCPCVKGEVRN